MKKLFFVCLCFSSLSAEVTLLTKENVSKIFSQPYVIVDVYAEWCPPCKKFGPVFLEVSTQKMDEIWFAKASIDGDSGVAERFDVLSIPTVIFLKNGKEVGRELGYMNQKTLTSKIESYFGKNK